MAQSHNLVVVCCVSFAVFNQVEGALGIHWMLQGEQNTSGAAAGQPDELGFEWNTTEHEAKQKKIYMETLEQSVRGSICCCCRQTLLLQCCCNLLAPAVSPCNQPYCMLHFAYLQCTKEKQQQVGPRYKGVSVSFGRRPHS